MHHQSTLAAGYLDCLGVQDKFYPLGAVEFLNQFTDFLIEGAQEGLASDHYRGVHSEGPENSCQFGSDVAVADYEHLGGQGSGQEEVVACGEQLFSFDVWENWRRTCGDQDVSGGVGLRTHLYCSGVEEGAPALDYVDVVLG